MSKLKKRLLMFTAYALVAALAIGGTVAYLTDRDSELNTFTVGDVEIDLEEGFEQNSELIPGVKVDKDAEIINIGPNDAWVWMTVLLPKELGPYTAPDNISASNNVVHWNYPKENAENIIVQFESTPVTLDPDGDGTENEYYRTSLLYNKILAKDETTDIMLSTVYMDKHVDIDLNGDWYWVDNGNATKLDWNSNTSGNPKLYVSAYAIQAENFEDVKSAYEAYNKQWGDNGAEYGNVEVPTIGNNVSVSAENIATMDFTQDNATYTFNGTFTDDVTIKIPEGLSQTFDGTDAVFEGNVVLDRGIAHAYSSLNVERTGALTITGFEAATLNVNAINMEKVSITNNNVHALSVAGGNFELVIDGNNINGNQGQYVTGNTEHNTVDYGISLRITDYELYITDNVITDTYSHAIGINGRQDEENTNGWFDGGANNKIKAFSGNNITVNSSKKSERAALKIWNDTVYAPYGTSGQDPNANATALMDTILADTTNVFKLEKGHTTFNIYDFKK